MKKIMYKILIITYTCTTFTQNQQPAIDYVQKCTTENNCTDFLRISNPYEGFNNLDALGTWLQSTEFSKFINETQKKPITERVKPETSLDVPTYTLQEHTNWLRRKTGKKTFIADIPIDVKNLKKTHKAIKAAGYQIAETRLKYYEQTVEFSWLVSQYHAEKNPNKQELLKTEIMKATDSGINLTHPVLRTFYQTSVHTAAKNAVEEGLRYNTNQSLSTIGYLHEKGFILSCFMAMQAKAWIDNLQESISKKEK